jgi:hypothetical protein
MASGAPENHPSPPPPPPSSSSFPLDDDRALLLDLLVCIYASALLSTRRGTVCTPLPPAHAAKGKLDAPARELAALRSLPLDPPASAPAASASTAHTHPLLTWLTSTGLRQTDLRGVAAAGPGECATWIR